MKLSIGIFYFSGTGNTEIITNLLKRELERKSASVELLRIEDFTKNKTPVNTEEYDIIGIGYPVHGFNAPRIVFAFLNLLQSAGGKKVFLFKTAGDFYIQGGATTMLRERLDRKGYEVFNENLIIMPSNILVKYPDELSKQLYNAATPRVKTMADEIVSEKEKLQENSLSLILTTAVVSWFESWGAHCFSKHLRVSKACTFCEKCINNCPKGNIYRKGNSIRFGWKCMICMRCFYLCPEQAIKAIGFNYIMFKSGYDIKKIINNPTLKGDFITKETRGYYNRFYKYIYGVWSVDGLNSVDSVDSKR